MIFTSCQKEVNDDEQQNKKTYLVKTMTDVDAQDPQEFHYTYDDKGRITTEEHLQEGTNTYTYTDSSVMEKKYRYDGSLEVTNEYKLGADGLAKSCVSDDRTIYYTYNNAGQLTRSHADVYDAGGAYNFTYDTKNYYTNNNIDSVLTTNTYNSQSATFVEEYYDEYYTAKPNILDNANFGMPWLGKGSKNLVKKGRYWLLPSSPMEVYTITYEFDNLGRVAKAVTIGSQGDSLTTVFTYY